MNFISFQYFSQYQIAKIFLGFLLLECIIVVKCKNIQEVESSDTSVTKSILQQAKQEKCVTKYEKVEQVVHDTVFQQQCFHYNVSQCNVTHVPAVQDTTQTRCVPSYNTKCSKVKKTELRKECKLEYKAECFQVIIKVKYRIWSNYNFRNFVLGSSLSSLSQAAVNRRVMF